MLLGTSIPEYYTIKEFAEAYGVSEQSIKTRVFKNTIDYYRLGTGNRTTVLIPRSYVLTKKKAGRKPKSKVDSDGESR